MPVVVRSMLILGLLALLAAAIMVRRAEQPVGSAPHSTSSIGTGKPVGTSTLSHGGPASTANQSDARDSGSQH
jgi:hypothetical protein